MRLYAFPVISLSILAAAAFAQGKGQAQAGGELSYFGRASVKIKTASGLVIYVDPYAPGDYSEPADLILVTHGHSDHNQTGLVARKADTLVASPAGAVPDKGAKALSEGAAFELSGGGLKVTVLPAANKNHPRKDCVGYLLAFDGLTLYHAGDTSYLPEMEGYAKYAIDYALLPCDGFYNMGAQEAARSAAAMKAKQVLPIHSDKSGDFNEANARAVGGPGLIVLKPGESIGLEE